MGPSRGRKKSSSSRRLFDNPVATWRQSHGSSLRLPDPPPPKGRHRRLLMSRFTPGARKLLASSPHLLPLGDKVDRENAPATSFSPQGRELRTQRRVPRSRGEPNEGFEQKKKRDFRCVCLNTLQHPHDSGSPRTNPVGRRRLDPPMEEAPADRGPALPLHPTRRGEENHSHRDGNRPSE